MSSTPAPAPVSAESLTEELEAHLDLFVRVCPGEPTFAAVPVVLPAGPGRFALRDPSSINPSSPKDWTHSSGRTGVAVRGQATQIVPRSIPGRPYPKTHPSAKVFTAQELEDLRGTIDTDDGSPLDLAHQQSEGLYTSIVQAATEAGVKAGLRLAFVVRFVVAKLPPGYFREETEEARAANLDRCVRHAVAAATLKEAIFASYEAKIAEAEAAEIRTVEAPDAARIAALEEAVRILSARFPRA